MRLSGLTAIRVVPKTSNYEESVFLTPPAIPSRPIESHYREPLSAGELKLPQQRDGSAGRQPFDRMRQT